MILNGAKSANGFPLTYLNTCYPPAYEINPLVSFRVDGAIRKGLRYDPERRHGDVSAFLHELQHPNPKYKQHYRALLQHKTPVRFWQYLPGGLFVAFCVALYF